MHVLVEVEVLAVEGDGFIDVLGAAEIGRQDAGCEAFPLPRRPPVEDARLLGGDRSQAHRDGWELPKLGHQPGVRI